MTEPILLASAGRYGTRVLLSRAYLNLMLASDRSVIMLKDHGKAVPLSRSLRPPEYEHLARVGIALGGLSFVQKREFRIWL
jgi:hypothetical protein